MGCNTSKESVQPVEGEEKTEDQPNNVESNENELNSKPASADSTIKATTPTTNSAKSEARLSNHIAESTAATETEPGTETQVLVNGDSTTAEEVEAAVKIQAVFRGHQTRLTMKQADGKSAAAAGTEPEPTKEQLEAEFRADDVELCKAATTIQNSFRSHMKTKADEAVVGKDGGSSASGKQENKEEEEELDIDLTDPDLNKAATKIQASFRGHKARRETEGTDSQ